NTYTSLIGGAFHACGILASVHLMKCWGDDSQGQIGDADGTGATKNSPTYVYGNPTFSSGSANAWNTCGVAFGGGPISCWGDNSFGQLGDPGFESSSSNVPHAVSASGVTFTSVAVGLQHVCALDNSNVAHCWGNNDFGQLGDNTTTSRAAQAAISGY